MELAAIEVENSRIASAMAKLTSKNTDLATVNRQPLRIVQQAEEAFSDLTVHGLIPCGSDQIRVLQVLKQATRSRAANLNARQYSTGQESVSA